MDRVLHAAEAPNTLEARLVELLLQRGDVDARAVDRASRVAADDEQRVDKVLIQLGLVSERGLAEAFSELTQTPIAKPDVYKLEAPLFADRLTPRFLRAARALPVEADEMTVTLAMADPLDRYTPAAVAVATGRSVKTMVAIPIDLDAALDRLYPKNAATEPATPGGSDPEEADAERLKDLASEAPIIRMVNTIISRAVETGASDIHVEPFEDRLRIRYRHDGILEEIESPPRAFVAAITSRIKIMARLDIAERRMPQDGRIRLPVRGQDVDFRVSTIPSLHGETLVMRVLDRTAVTFEFAKLGLPPLVIQQIGRALEMQNGIVLVTGPTGSGKTTTLYSGLLSLNAVERKIVTIEDPIEYELPGVSQVQVQPGIGLTFAGLLRHIVRQDPNVIMVGEIRDVETASIAAQAALTGHLVLSTLHTNSAAATVTRLRDMGLEDYLLTAVLRGVLAQRLVRRLCRHCKREHPAAAATIARFGLDKRGHGATPMLCQPVGCEHCRQTGYRGRMAIAEFLVPDPAIERLIYARADQNEIERAAVAAGMVTMFQAGLDAAVAGETTIEEILLNIQPGS
jgi:general secretion pathway protein E